MADPLSMTASLAGIVQLASTVFHALSQYVRDAKHAKARLAELTTETRNLGGILHNLSLLVVQLEDENSLAAFQAHHLHACRKTLLAIKDKTSKAQRDFDSGRRRDLVSRSMKWPFSGDETKALLDDMMRHKSNIALALSADSMEMLTQCLSKQDSVSDELKGVRETMEARFEAETRVRLDQARRGVLQFFTKVNPKQHYQAALDLRHPMTGLWLLDDPKFLSWKNIQDSKLWLSGIPGSGKTVLCAAMIENVLQETNSTVAASYFFCDYRDQRSQAPDAILGSIAAQVGRQNPKAFEVLQGYYDELHPKDGLDVKALKTTQLIEVINAMVRHFDRVFVVVDALDECAGATVAVLHALTSLADECEGISLALLSRDEEDICEHLNESFSHLRIEAQTADLELYVGAEMSRRKNLKDLHIKNSQLNTHIREHLVREAKGMFRWVSCQLEYLSNLPTNRARREALDKLPPTLNTTYERILESLSASSSHKNLEGVMQKALWWIGMASPPLTISALCEAVSVTEEDRLDPDDIINETEILRVCSSLIRKTHDGLCFEYAHSTVQQYLESISPDSSLNRFRLAREKSALSLAVTSLRFLLFPQFDRAPVSDSDESEWEFVQERAIRHPFYRYAAKNWFRHTNGDLDEPTLFALCRTFFDLRRSGNFLSWIVEFVGHFASKLYTQDDSIIPEFDDFEEWFEEFVIDILGSSFCTLHLAAALGQPRLVRHMVNERANTNTRSSFGTPLHCALAGFEIFLGNHSGSYLYIRDYEWDHLDERRSLRRRETIDTFLEYGAEPEATSGTQTSMHLALELCIQKMDAAFILPFIQRKICWPDDAVVQFKELCDFSDSSVMQDISMAILSAYSEEQKGIAVSSQMRQVVALAQLIAPSAGSAGGQIGRPGDFASKISDTDFTETLRLAILRDRDGEVSDLIADTRFRNESVRGTGGTIVHDAAYYSAAKVLTLLAELDFDLTSVDQSGATALHQCYTDRDAHAAELLLRKDVNSTIRNADGNTIWHRVVQTFSHDTLNVLLRHDPRKMAALKVLSNNGRTPVSEALFLGYQDMALAMLLICPPGDETYVASDRSVLNMAAPIGSERLFRAILLQLGGLKDRQLDPSRATPLHYVDSSAEVSFIKYLTTIYGIRDRGNDGKVPIETVLDRLPNTCDEECDVTHEQIRQLKELADQELIKEMSSEERDIWRFWHRDVLSHCSHVTQDFCDIVVDGTSQLLLDLGALSDYEEKYSESGIILLLETYLQHPESIKWTWPSVQRAISASKLFHQTLCHPSTLRLAQTLLSTRPLKVYCFLSKLGSAFIPRLGGRNLSLKRPVGLHI